jgi:prepilin-type N-terminal cleavage/methylation domain-containing protein
MTKESQAGFTLVEVMIAILLTVIAVMGIVGLMRAESRTANRSRHLSEASVLAQGKMEELRATQSFTTTTSGTGSDASPVDPQGNSGGIFTRAWSWAPNATITSAYNYTTTVSWTEDGTATSVTMIGIRQ